MAITVIKTKKLFINSSWGGKKTHVYSAYWVQRIVHGFGKHSGRLYPFQLCFHHYGNWVFSAGKTEKALDALKDLASPRALVIRDGAETRIAGIDVVTEDILLLQESGQGSCRCNYIGIC